MKYRYIQIYSTLNEYTWMHIDQCMMLLQLYTHMHQWVRCRQGQVSYEDTCPSATARSLLVLGQFLLDGLWMICCCTGRQWWTHEGEAEAILDYITTFEGVKCPASRMC